MPAAAEAEAALAPPAVVVQCDGPFRHEQRWRGTGLAVPVFALRTRNSVGVGEFVDIKQLADFCSAAGVHSCLASSSLHKSSLVMLLIG